MGYLENHIWRTEVSDGSLFCNFQALSFEVNLLLTRVEMLTMFGNFPCVVQGWVSTAFDCKQERFTGRPPCQKNFLLPPWELTIKSPLQ